MTRLTKPNARTVLIAILLHSSMGPPWRRSNTTRLPPRRHSNQRINQCWRRNALIQRLKQILLPNRRRLREVKRRVGPSHPVVSSCMSSLADPSLATLEPSRRSLPTPPSERATAAEARRRETLLLDITGTLPRRKGCNRLARRPSQLARQSFRPLPRGAFSSSCAVNGGWGGPVTELASLPAAQRWRTSRA